MSLTQGRSYDAERLNKSVFHQHLWLYVLKMLVHTESGQRGARSSPGEHQLRVRDVSSVSFRYLLKQSYTDNSSREDLISTDDKPIPKGLTLWLK